MTTSQQTEEPAPTSTASIALFDSVTTSDLTALSLDLAEVAIDGLLKEGTLRDIPILGSLASLAKAGIAFRDRIYLRKVFGFLKVLSSARPEDRVRISEYLSTDRERQNFGENVLILIDKADDVQKPQLMGHIWAACAEGSIPYHIAMRLCYMINRVYWSDLHYLRSMQTGVQRENTAIAESLFAAGFVSNAGFDAGNVSDPLSSGVRYAINEFGDIIVEHGLSKMA